MTTTDQDFTTRIYAFDEAEQLHRIGKDLYFGLRFLDGECGDLRNQTVRIAYVSIVTVDKKPDRILQINGERWSMNRYGQPDARTRNLFWEDRRLKFAKLEKLLPDDKANEVTDTQVVDFEKLFTEKLVSNALSWEPTDHEVTRIVNDIWPETAGKADTLAKYLKSSEPKRAPLSYDAKHAFDELWKPVFSIKRIFEVLGDKDLKGLADRLAQELDDNLDKPGNKIYAGILDAVKYEIERRRAWKRNSGVWYAECEISRKTPNYGAWEVISHRVRKCKSKKDAEKNAQEMLRDNAKHFSATTRVDVNVMPEIEWYQGRVDEETE